MNIGLSHLAFDSAEIYSKLKNLGFSYVEGVLTKISPWDSLSQTSLNQFKSDLNINTLDCYSIQSIFYNTPITTLCDKKVMVHFCNLIEYCKMLDTKIMVLGSPNLRKIEPDYIKKLDRIFSQLDVLLEDTGIKVVLEPNCHLYKGEYFYSSSEIKCFIKANNLQNIKTMIDTHNLLNEGFDPIKEFERNIEVIEHIHISENDLKPIHNIEFHKSFAEALKSNWYNKGVTYEVKKTDSLDLEHFVSIYGTNNSQ